MSSGNCRKHLLVRAKARLEQSRNIFATSVAAIQAAERLSRIGQ